MSKRPTEKDPMTKSPSIVSVNSSPRSSPSPVRSGMKRKHQSRIGDHFLPGSSSPIKRRSTVIESDSESDTLDHIQLEPEPSEPQTPDPASDDDSDVIVSPSVRRRRYLPSSPSSDDDEDDPQTLPPKASEEELSDDEVRDIASSARKASVSSRMRDSVSRNKRKSAFQKNLENLLKKKQGLQEESDEESDQDEDEESGDDGKALYDSESDVDSVETDDFVVDNDKEMTMEEMMEIPPEFTSVSYQGPQLNFKVVVQGEIYALLHPDYHGLDYSSIRRHLSGLMLDTASTVDPYFTHAFKSLERQVTGITDSAISSNAWKPWFMKVLRERPIFESNQNYDEYQVCDACNISKRYTSNLMELTIDMQPFLYVLSARNIITRHSRYVLHCYFLQKSIPDNNEVWVYWDNENKHFLDRCDVHKSDIKHNLVTKADIRGPWALGGFCHSMSPWKCVLIPDRAEIAHYFYHWRWNLREQVKTALGYIGYMNQEKKIQIRNLAPELRHKYIVMLTF
jgi:hypothetical protein